MSKAKRIRFPCKWREPLGEAPIFFGQREAMTDFKLGIGPCGKEVIELSFGRFDGGFFIHQTHVDGTSKDFYYKWDDITGRVEVEQDGW